MKITKFGQCCLLIEVAGKRVLTDPGVFSTTQNDLTNLDLILITHEHGDHLHSESLQAILEKKPRR
jgi:L-ascorbate metabolism protein UlaG (beta-lactamase superfamily)